MLPFGGFQALMTSSGRSRVRFSGFELDLRSGELWDPTGRRLRLPRQPLRTLVVLVRAQGDVVLREDLRRELWPDNTFVDYEHGINATIRRLRDTIGDDAAAPRFIETIPGVGYRFIAPATFVEPGTSVSPTAAAESAANPRHAEAVGGPTPPGWSGTRRGIAVGITAIAAVAVLLVAHWLSGSPPRHTLLRLTSTSGLSVDPALSSDGLQLAFASDREGTTGLDIWLQSVAGGGSARRLTTDKGDEVEPSFSPDGGYVFYSRRETGGIYRIGTNGGEPKLIVPSRRARMPRVSADGQWIMYSIGQPVFTGADGTPVPGATSSLAVVPVEGGTPTYLATSLASARYGVWSPDGRRILFLGQTPDGGFEWFVIPREGGEPRPTGAVAELRREGINGVPIPGDWSKTHDVVFATPGSEASNVWQVPISPESGLISGRPTRLTFGSAEERSPSVSSAQGTVFSSVTENVDVYRIPLDPHSGVSVGSPERVTDDAAIDQTMNLTGDGATLLFISRRTKAPEAWLRNERTGRQRQLTFDGAIFGRLHPDGSRVALRRPGRDKVSEILRIEDGVPTRICQDCQIDDWSPDGSKVMIERGHPAALFIRDVATGLDRPLASHPEWNLFRGRFSPDGRWIVFHTTNSTELRQIYVVPAGESAEVPVSRWVPVVKDFGIQPAWALDGRGIYYFSLRDGYFCAWMQPVDGGTARPVGEARAVHHLHNPRLQAASGAIVDNDVRGNFLYVTLTEREGNIWMVRE